MAVTDYVSSVLCVHCTSIIAFEFLESTYGGLREGENHTSVPMETNFVATVGTNQCMVDSHLFWV